MVAKEPVGIAGPQFSMGRRGLLAAVGGAGLVALTACSSDGSGSAGGGSSTLRVGIAGGSPSDNFDAALVNGASATTRTQVFYETLTWMDGKMEVHNWLCEELTPNDAADRWTVKLKQGVKFHNGKVLDSGDVLASLERIMDPKVGATAAGQLSALDMGRSKAIDASTVELVLTRPTAILPAILSNIVYIVPAGYDPAKPVSTGPWKFLSYTPGQSTQLERFDDYWGEKAQVRRLVLQELPDDAARINALLSGEVEIANQVPYIQVALLEGNKNLKLAISETAAFTPITMRTDQAPFDDVRVRQAMRLVMDREQAVATALHGQGTPAGDVAGRFGGCVDTTPRAQDVAAAKALLAEAGHTELSVELVVNEVGAGITDACQILAENAKEAGIDITIRKVDAATFFGRYGEWPFAVDYWPGQPYLPFSALTEGPGSDVLNVTHFKDKAYDATFSAALSELDEDRRCAHVKELADIDRERGGMIVWAFQNTVAAYSSKLEGYEVTDRTGWGLDRCRLHRIRFA